MSLIKLWLKRGILRSQIRSQVLWRFNRADQRLAQNAHGRMLKSKTWSMPWAGVLVKSGNCVTLRQATKPPKPRCQNRLRYWFIWFICNFRKFALRPALACRNFTQSTKWVSASSGNPEKNWWLAVARKHCLCVVLCRLHCFLFGLGMVGPEAVARFLCWGKNRRTNGNLASPGG